MGSDAARHGGEARSLLAWLVRDGQPLATPTAALDADPLAWPGYADRRAQARRATGLDEAVVAVRGTIDGSEAVVAAWDFGFLGGSMSSAVGAIVAAAYDSARAARLPMVVLPSTGGARLQEGMAALVQMAATTVAATEHAQAGLLQVAVLRHPTTGGVFASHANLADIVLAEPGATIGFAGPRVAEAFTGGPLPSGSHTAIGARAAGLIDDVVASAELPGALARILQWSDALRSVPRAAARPTGNHGSAATHPFAASVEQPDDAWDQFQRARAPDRPRTADYLAALDVAYELHGDRAGRDDPALRVVLARLAGRPLVVVGLDRSGAGGRVGPGGYRKAWRGLRLADRLGVPILTLVDTPGADASAAAEASGVAHHIARTFAEVLAVRTPVVALVIGEGGSGGALALSVGDRVLIQEHAVFSVIAPEGASAILHRSGLGLREVTARLKPSAGDLAALGIADAVVPEPPGREIDVALAAVAAHLDDLTSQPESARRDARRTRWRHAGQPV